VFDKTLCSSERVTGIETVQVSLTCRETSGGSLTRKASISLVWTSRFIGGALNQSEGI
jgi:hypothetical protein